MKNLGAHIVYGCGDSKISSKNSAVAADPFVVGHFQCVINSLQADKGFSLAAE